jgi:hypothetical protein
MTYYRILQYLKKNGLDDGKAHYVRNMIRELVNQDNLTDIVMEAGQRVWRRDATLRRKG